MDKLDTADMLFEHAGTIHRDFSHSKYHPTGLKARRFHSGTLLNYLLRRASLRDQVNPILSRLRAHLGEDETIWGVKWISEAIASFEFYVSNRDEPTPVKLRNFDTLRAVLHPWLEDVIPPWERCPYTMISFEVTVESAQRQRADNVHIYLSSHLRTVAPDGYSYELERENYRLRNHYRHFILEEWEALRDRFLFSPHISSITDIDVLLPQHHFECRSISYAAKQVSDGVYFRRLPPQWAVEFASTFGLSVVEEILRHYESEFEHLCWDVGLDFGRSPNSGEHPLVRKVAIYGIW